MLLIRNKKSIFAESFTRMKQRILERIGYSERIERMFGRGMMIALTGQRRVGNLKLIKDSHPKYVISMDRLYGQTNIDGIKHIHLRDFLKMTTVV